VPQHFGGEDKMKEFLVMAVFLSMLPLAAPAVEDFPACRRSYARLFRDEVEIRIVFGYKDARPARFVGDGYERAYFLGTLLKPCKDSGFACGFRRSQNDADLLEKEIPGPDHHTHHVRLRIVASSAGPDDRENSRDPFQQWKSAKAKREFFEGLRSADAVFYDGHSRDGGGPDFAPPRLDQAGHVDYAWYQQNRFGLRRMERELKNGNSPAKVVGLFSCRSDRFLPKHGLSQGIAWITYGRLYYFADALLGMKDSLAALLSERCPEDFAFALKKTDHNAYLRGFF
jgi:hypothetical protein